MTSEGAKKFVKYTGENVDQKIPRRVKLSSEQKIISNTMFVIPQ